MRLKKIKILVCFLLSAISILAQQENQFTQYTFNQAIINPAYIGSTNYMNLQISGRNQWIGFPGAPKSGAVNFGYPLKYFNSAIGITAMQDNIGPLQNTFLSFVYAHSVKINRKVKLSMGLSVGTSLYSANLKELKTLDNNDATLMEGSINENRFTFGSGAFLYSQNWYVGLSIPKIATRKFALGTNGYDTFNLKERNHIYLISGYVFSFGKIKLKPATCIKKVMNVKPSFDFSLATSYQNKYSVGGGIRNPNTFFGFVQIAANNFINIGYAYDIAGSRMKSASKGSHEIILDFKLSRDATKIHSPRFF